MFFFFYCGYFSFFHIMSINLQLILRHQIFSSPLLMISLWKSISLEVLFSYLSFFRFHTKKCKQQSVSEMSFGFCVLFFSNPKLYLWMCVLNFVECILTNESLELKMNGTCWFFQEGNVVICDSKFTLKKKINVLRLFRREEESFIFL